MKILWTLSYDTQGAGDGVSLYADEGGLVFVKQSGEERVLDVVDTETGKVFATATLGDSANVLSVESGLIVTEDYVSLCARPLTDPGSCKWKAADPFLLATTDDNPTVFGAGKWVNTGKGVVELATGKPAPFGADANGGDVDEPAVYYSGDAADRVFRVECSYASESASDCRYQPWNIEKDAALSAPVMAAMVTAPAGEDYFVAVDRSFRISRYSWATGKLKWRFDYTCPNGYCDTIFSSASVTGNVYVLDLNPDQLLVDVRTGKEVVLENPGDTTYDFAGREVIYCSDGYTVIAYAAGTDGFPALWSLDSSTFLPEIFAMSGHVFAVSDEANWLRVLNP